MVIEYKLDEGAYAPVHGHEADAGFDLRLPKSDEIVVVSPHDSIIINTGVHFNIPEGYTGFIKSKSGLNMKNNILVEGVVDAGYTGPVIVKLYNHGNEYVHFQSGDKLTQIVFLPIPRVSLCYTTSEFSKTERGDNGFGSTGR